MNCVICSPVWDLLKGLKAAIIYFPEKGGGNFKPSIDGIAKAYQVKQVRTVILKYKLNKTDE